MFANAMILAMTLWGGAIALSTFLRADSENSKMAAVLGWSMIITTLAVQNGAFREFLMGTIILPIIILSYRHLRGQQKMHARAKAYGHQQNRRPDTRR